MTDARTDSNEGEGSAVRALFRRAGHELRNAQNAVAVNVEVVRSRVAAGKTDAASLESFAENAAKGMEQSSQIGEAMIALCGAVALSASRGGLSERSNPDGTSLVELKLAPESARQLVQRLSAGSGRAGVAVEATATGVILTLLPEHETHRA